MAKHAVKMLDVEMHVMEPVDLWERYIDPRFKARAPRRLNERRWDIRTLVDGEVMSSRPGGPPSSPFRALPLKISSEFPMGSGCW